MLQDLLQLLLGLVPDLNVSNVLLRAGGKLHLEGETKNTVHMVHELDAVENLLANLIAGAENVGIILLETTHTGQSSQSTRQLVTKISKTVALVLSIGSDAHAR